jgi:transmembrane sensor
MSVNTKRLIDETAARWFIRMQHAEPDAPERSEFEAWLIQDAQHQKAYISICDAWNDIDSVDHLKKLATARQTDRFEKQTKRAKKTKNLVATLSVCFAIGIAGLFGYQQWQSSPTMQMASQSEKAQILTQTLDDGSQITLNANSKVQVTYYRNQRQVTLLQGEAIFNVTKDAKRPFIVDTETASVKVLGTRFAVNKLSKLIRVSVDHGSVLVESKDNASNIILHNNQVAEIYHGELVQFKQGDATDYFKFATGKIVFNQADIVEIADVLSRYRQKPVRTEGSSQEKISAVFEAKDTETFINTLPRIANISIHQSADETVIRSEQ